MPITKSELLNGRNAVVLVHIDALDNEIALRPLTAGELAQADALASRGQVVRPKMGNITGGATNVDIEVNVETSTLAQFDANCMLAALAMSVNGDTYTAEEVSTLAPNVLSEIVDKVREMSSGEKTLEDAATFREE